MPLACMGRKRLELAHELVLAATTTALLVNPIDPHTETLLSNLQAAARTLGVELAILHASTDVAIEDAFAAAGRRRASALVIGSDLFFNHQSRAQRE
jgi:putative ABC transport system substrate-binding protein